MSAGRQVTVDAARFEQLGAALDRWRMLLAELVTLLVAMEKFALHCRDAKLQADVVAAMEAISAKGVAIGRDAWEVSLLAEVCAGVDTPQARREAH